MWGIEKPARIAFLLKRTTIAVRSRAKVLSITTDKRRRWTKAQLRILRREYADATTATLVERTGHTRLSVYQKAQKLGLHKSAEFHADAKRSGRFDNLSRAGERFRYPKGHVPANKGLRRPGWSPGRMATTQFKKGQKPHTYRFAIGDHRINTDGYIDQKIREDLKGSSNWRPLHRILWEKENGPVPAGHMVSFRDGDKLHCTFENLELITRAENARRNSIWRRMPKELASLVMLRSKIQRQINKREGRAKENNRERREAARRAVRNARRIARQGKPDGHRQSEGRGASR
jgi:hypothetical protein